MTHRKIAIQKNTISASPKNHKVLNAVFWNNDHSTPIFTTCGTASVAGLSVIWILLTDRATYSSHHLMTLISHNIRMNPTAKAPTTTTGKKISHSISPSPL